MMAFLPRHSRQLVPPAPCSYPQQISKSRHISFAILEARAKQSPKPAEDRAQIVLYKIWTSQPKSNAFAPVHPN